MTRDKLSSEYRTVIIDLRWPIGQYLNSGVSSDKYLDTEFVLTYPSVDNISDEILKLGKHGHITQVICLGIVANTENFSVSILAEKLSLIKDLCKKWSNKKSVQIQSSSHC